jgi:hypothetical protein
MVPWIRRFAGVMLWLLVAFQSAFALETADQYLIKSAYLYKFALFAEWPTPVTDHFQICVLGPDPFGDRLRALEDKQIQSVPVAIRRVAAAGDATHCQVLFINPSNRAEMVEWLVELARWPILTVSDRPDAFEEGVIIALQTDPNRISFRINLAKARKAGLSLRAQLLQLANEVR